MTTALEIHQHGTPGAWEALMPVAALAAAAGVYLAFAGRQRSEPRHDPRARREDLPHDGSAWERIERRIPALRTRRAASSRGAHSVAS